VKLFYSYAHEDSPYRDRLESHLKALEREGLLSGWSDAEIVPGAHWRAEIDMALGTADVVIFLVSADFIASDFIWDVEIGQALARHANGSAIVIPVIVRPADWQHTVLGSLQALPTGGRAVTEWDNEDSAWVNVVTGLRRAITDHVREPAGGTTPGDPELTTRMLVSQGEGLLWIGRGQDAVATLDAAIAKQPLDWDAYLARARALMLRGRAGEALDAFNAVLAQLPDNPEALVGRAQTQAGMGRFPAAFSDVDQVVRSNQHDWYARFVRGSLHEAQGTPDKALKDYDAALKQEPQAVPALVARGYLHGRQGRHMRAVEDFTRALALNPNILGAIVGRGWSYVALKRYSEASAEFERALALDPNNVFALNGKAEAQQHPVGAGRLKTLIHEVFT